MSIQRRDNAYYLQRLKKDRPDLHLEVQGGRMTVAQARKLAGLGGSRTRLHELRNSWRHATPKERHDFLAWAGVGVITTPWTGRPAGLTTAWSADMTMLDWAKRRLIEIMTRRRLSYGDVADELGIKRLDASVASAVRSGTKVKSASSRSAVDRWLASNASI